jgi:hypothetical protein
MNAPVAAAQSFIACLPQFARMLNATGGAH